MYLYSVLFQIPFVLFFQDFKPYRLLTISRPLEGDRPGSPQVGNFFSVHKRL